ncbi:hypothetical protein G3I20_29270, partial [Streptomyces sp. SID8111]|uniref:hypothetical protein n=1 Tax=Streptomyces sp. SID8111 TaxID=2706100 RepID=UPI0013C0C442
PAAVPPAPAGGDGFPSDPGNGDLESGATMRFSAAALKREFQQRDAAAEAAAQAEAQSGAQARPGAGGQPDGR